MKYLLLSFLSFSTPLVCLAQGQTQFELKLNAVACTYAANGELEECKLAENPVRERIVQSLKRTTIGDFRIDSAQLNKKYLLKAPQRAEPVPVQVTFSVIRDAGTDPALTGRYAVGGEVGSPTAEGEYRGYSTVHLDDLKSFKGVDIDGDRPRYPLENGRTLEVTAKLEVFNLVITE